MTEQKPEPVHEEAAFILDKARGLVREMLAYAAARMMEVEVELRTGAANGTRSPLREVQRIGYREWDRDVLVGTAASGK